MKLRDLINYVQIRDKVEICVMDGLYVQDDPTEWVKQTGRSKCIYKSKRGTDFRKQLETKDVDEEYLDYNVYCICGTTSTGMMAIDIRKPEVK